ncbi:DUF1636 domain-containing protein [Celeribacter halophilus]|uniref:DUF1636 domain-containing protein n=1 Tax=Celeribacter halophilus TaxID=576117 RepID=UPI002FD4530D
MADSELLVCVKCRKGQQGADDIRPGQRLFDTLSRHALPEGLRLRAVECLQNCNAGCSVALRGGNRWTYVYGGLDAEADAPMLLDGAARYHATADGLIPWRERPDHFKRNCVARVPPLDFPDVTSEAET